MSQEIINVLNYLGEQLGIVIDWSSENIWPQVMDVLGRYRLMEIILRGFWVFVEIGMMVAAVIIFYKMIKAYIKIKKTKEDNFWWSQGGYSIWPTGLGYTFIVIGILCILFGFISFVFEIEEFAKWVFIPEIKYLEMLKGLMG